MTSHSDQFELTVTHKGVTVYLEAKDAPSLRHLSDFLNSLTEQAIETIKPRAQVKRRGRPAKK